MQADCERVMKSLKGIQKEFGYDIKTKYGMHVKGKKWNNLLKLKWHVMLHN